MKLSSSFQRLAPMKFAALMLTGVLALPALLSAASPNITGTSANVTINDAQTSAIFGSANIIEGDTNVLTVYVDYGPTNYGTVIPLPAGMVQSGTNYLIAATSGNAAEAILNQLTFTPIANLIPVANTSNVTFHVYIIDASTNSNTSATRTTTLHIYSTNDVPVLTASGTTNITDKFTNAMPFQNVTVSEVDNGGVQAQTLRVSVTDTNNGYLITNSASAGFVSNNFTYTVTGTPAQVQAAVRGLTFVPVENYIPVGRVATNAFTIIDSDGIGSATNRAVKVLVTSINDAPDLTGITTNHIGVQTGQSALPFSVLTFVESDQNTNLSITTGENVSWTITLSGPSPLGSLEVNGNSIGTNYFSASDPDAATAALRNMSYRAPTLTIAGTNVLTVTITASDDHGSSLTTNIYLDLFSVTIASGLSGAQSGQTVNDNTTIALFNKVNIQSFNGAPITVRASLGGGATNDLQGSLINLGGFVRTTSPTAPSSYEFSGTSESATAGIRALLFQPTPNRINGSSTDLVRWNLVMVGEGVTNQTTTVQVFPVNDVPTITGISPLVTIQDNETVPPFSTVLIGDADEGGQQPVIATITLDVAAKGGFSTNSLIASGFASGGGSYTYSNSAANVSAAIHQLVFVPAPNRVPVGLTEITTFNINLNDQHGGIIANNSTAVRVSSVSGLPVISVPSPQPVSIPSGTNIFPFQQVSVSDATTLKVSLRINNTAQGTFKTASVTAAGFTNLGGGYYYKAGAATNITAALALLDFTPSVNLPLGAVINFTISATNTLPNNATASHAIVLRTVQNSFIVTKLTDYDPANPPSSGQQNGTLRKAIADAKNNDHITFDIRSAVPGQPDYPAVIHLVAPIVLDNNLTFDGPGAERLTISGDSDVNGTADVQLFTVNADVTMNRLAFTKGHASFAGGAFEVTPFGDLTLSYCNITECSADVWGGGVDVDQGSLAMDHCLVANNRTSIALGQGGGGVSLYTYWPCSIVNTTFATNRQDAFVGLGGGALYAETADAGIELSVPVLSCTFRDNRDAATNGSSIRPNVFNTVVKLQNSILADGQGKNIEMDLSGAVLSFGGNISDDSTATIFSAGGAATNTFIFHTPADQVNVNVTNLLALLAANGGPTPTYALTPGSSAINAAYSNTPAATFYSKLGTDQRGFFRDATPDIGAFERNASQRVVIQELRANPAPPNTNDEFIEVYVPRDSAALDLGGFKVLVDGVLRHTFTSQPLQPGEAVVLFSAGAVNTALPSGVYSQTAAGSLTMDNAGGVVTLLNASNQTVFIADYVSAFTSTDPQDPGFLAANYQSLVLSPEFVGVFLPYQRVVAKAGGSDTNGLANPGYDSTGKPLAIGNAPPVAFDDLGATDAHTPIAALNVLVNDLDPDITDAIRVVDVGTNGNVIGATNYSVLGARLVINTSPTGGASISYDPTASAYLTALPQGSNVVDSFKYSILDASNGVDHVRGNTAPEITLNLAKATATVTVNVVGVNSNPTPQTDDVTTRTNLTTPEDVVLDFTTVTNILWNDTDPNTDDNSSTLNIVSISPTNGYVVNNYSVVSALGAAVTLDIRFDRNETHLTYDPRGSAILNALGSGQTTNDTFYYSVKDRYNAVGTAAIRIQVTGVNDRPTANPNAFATDEDTSVTNPAATFLANDTDYDNATTLHISAVSPLSALGASVTIDGTNVIYNPTVSTNLNALANKEFATDTFTYTATDENGLSSNAVVTVTVAGVNDHPITQPDAYTTDEETPFATNTLGVLLNDFDPDVNGILPDDSIRVIPATNTTPIGMTVVVNANGSLTYNPHGLFDWLKAAQPTNEVINYVVMDHSLSIAGNDSFCAAVNSTNNLLPVLANDVVLSQVGGAFTLTGVTTPNHGGTAVITNNAIRYSPFAGYLGAETFSYTVTDGIGGSDTAVVTVTVAGSTLFANADAFTVAQGTTNALDVLANDLLLPVSGASISITALGTPSLGGTVSLNGVGPNNLINYTPNPTNASLLPETFSYTITSGTLSATGTVSVTVLNRAGALSATGDNFTVIAGSGNTSLDVLVNDVILPNPATNQFITAIATNGVTGTVSINSARTRIIYKPSSALTNGTDTLFSYTITDNAGGTATANVSVSIKPSGFIANDDTFVVVRGSSNTLPVMINDVILPNLGQTLFISGIGIGTNAPNHSGAVTINGPGTGLVYVPAANFSGEENFTYEITDGSPARALGHVKVVVLDFSPATSNPDTYRVARDSVNNPLPVLKNDYSLPKLFGALTITGLQTNSVHGTVARNSTATNNALLYSPTFGFIGTDMFAYECVDTFGNKGTNLVTVTVGGVYPKNDLFTVLSGSATNALDVRANDLIFPDSASLRLVSQLGTPDQGGTVTTNAGATGVVYSPAPGFAGVEHFTYQLKDDTANLYAATATVVVARRGSDRDTNTVTLNVIGVNDVPTIVGGSNNRNITDKQTVNPFSTIQLGDLDEYGQQLVTVQIAMDNLDKESLQNLGGFLQTTPGIFLMHDTPTNITTALRGIVYVPVENHIIVPTTVTTRLVLSVDDGYILSPVTNLTTVAVTAVNDAPTTAGAVASSITDKQIVNPFAGIVIGEVDDDTVQSLTARIALDHLDNQTLTNLGGFTVVSNGVFTLTGTATNLTTALRGITFVPVENHIIVPTTVTTRLTLTVNDNFAPVVTNANTTVSVTAVNDTPTTAGANTYNITDKQTVNPFATLTIAEVDDDTLQALTVRLTLDHLDNQMLTNLGGFTVVTNGTFTLTGTATNLTAALRGMVFVPTPNHIPVPTSQTTRLTLTVDDTFAPIVTNALTTVTITATNDTPTFAGSGNYNITDKQTVQPFATLIVADVDNDGLQPLTVRLTLDNLDKGGLQNLGGFTQTSNGVFQLFGFPTNITTALRGMVYVPVPNHIPVPTTAAIHLNLSADDSYVSTPTTNLTTVSVTASNDVPVITGTVAGQIVYSRSFIRPFVGVKITEVDNDTTQALRVTVTLNNAANGNLSQLGGFADLGGGVYSMGVSNGSVTAATITTALRGLLFTPTTASRVTPGVSEVTRFTIRVDDFFAPTVVDSNTTVIAIAPQVAKVTASDRTVNSQFGWAVAATRDLAVVGAPHDSLNTNSGSVYLFARSLDGSNTWTQIKKILPPDGHANDGFGTAVSISGDTIVVGSPFDNSPLTDAGSAYIYYRNQGGNNQWGFVKKLVAPAPVASDDFGASVSISGDSIVVGVPLADGSSLDANGAAYIFDRNQGGADQWGQVKKLLAAVPVSNDRFGTSVSISGDDVAVGVPLADVPSLGDSGAVFVFGRNEGGAGQWGQVKKLVASDAAISDNFGSAVSFSADMLVAGSPFANVNHSGAAYLFGRNQSGSNQWGQVKKLTASDAVANDHFGSAVSIYLDTVVVSSPQAVSSTGAAYLFGQNQGGSNFWNQVDKFQPSTLSTSDNFGSGLAVFDKTVVVGAYNGLDSGVRYGTAFMFRLKFGNPPQVALPLVNQTVSPSSPLAYTIPAGVFTDPDVNETLVISVGTTPTAPVWLSFDSLTGAFSGTPSLVGNYPVAVVATDTDGLTATNSFTINVTVVAPSNYSLALGFQTFGANRVTVVSLSGTAGAAYKLQRTASLASPVIWTDVATGTADGSGAIVFTDSTTADTMFYRAIPQ